jgi:hypothetical protein
LKESNEDKFINILISDTQYLDGEMFYKIFTTVLISI